ncbi:YggS family pyridoxal phosphate-dependent enzyme [soil metagenome]
MGIKNNIEKFRTELKPFAAKLIAVSKTHPVDKIREAYESGQRIFGENKVQELTGKQPQFPADVEWHLIGHLQRNKVKFIAPFVSLIHSVDSLKLLEEINKEGQKINRVIPCLLQIYIANEETKFGLGSAEIEEMIQSGAIGSLSFVQVRGLMGIASLTENQEQIRKEFRSLKTLFESLKQKTLPANIQMTELSMGMSLDYKIALEEGTTLVRIGTAIFGARDYGNN